MTALADQLSNEFQKVSREEGYARYIAGVERDRNQGHERVLMPIEDWESTFKVASTLMVGLANTAPVLMAAFITKIFNRET